MSQIRASPAALAGVAVVSVAVLAFSARLFSIWPMKRKRSVSSRTATVDVGPDGGVLVIPPCRLQPPPVAVRAVAVFMRPPKEKITPPVGDEPTGPPEDPPVFARQRVSSGQSVFVSIDGLSGSLEWHREPGIADFVGGVEIARDRAVLCQFGGHYRGLQAVYSPKDVKPGAAAAAATAAEPNTDTAAARWGGRLPPLRRALHTCDCARLCTASADQVLPPTAPRRCPNPPCSFGGFGENVVFESVAPTAVPPVTAEVRRIAADVAPLPDATEEGASTAAVDAPPQPVDAASVCVGDVFVVLRPTVGADGDVPEYAPTGLVLAVRSPRRPCSSVDKKHGSTFHADGVRALCARTGLSGTFLRVLRSGSLAEGDVLRLVARPRPAWPLQRVASLFYGDRRWVMRYLTQRVTRACFGGTDAELAELAAMSELALTEYREDALLLMGVKAGAHKAAAE
eukprot:TRINITY_DN7954_c0_g1_i1.p1 TRINITY_DN7954_c0_g1~~TRINITY_DN7954_c0_g1_i1.p1  ORF type:complete len:469 (+),score=66.07 TRINITY_DN7954_c0_g1_i1:43-1407(+)